MRNNAYLLSMMLVIAAVTMLTRFLPFIVFRRKTPPAVIYLSGVLPYAIIGMLVVYCLKNVSLSAAPHGAPEALSLAAVVFVHRLRHNVLLSVLGGTLLYMWLVQSVFA